MILGMTLATFTLLHVVLSLAGIGSGFVVLFGLLAFRLSGAWRRGYVISALVALYLNVFVAVVQAFLKVPALKALAPTQKELPFVIAQLVVLLIFVGLTTLAAKRFTSSPVHAA